MNHGKQIRLFLTDGSANGIRYAELMNWTGQAFACPKSLFPNLQKWTETQRAGVYVLVGLNENGEEAVYIGESENVVRRILWHLGNSTLDDIVEAFFFTSKDDNLSKGHITFLEQRLVKRAEAAKQYIVEYGHKPSEKTLSKPEAATMEEFLENIYLVAATLGFTVFEMSPCYLAGPDRAGLFTLVLEHDVIATGYPSEEGFVIKSGSEAAAAEVASLQPGYKSLRADLKSKSVLVPEGDRLKFAQDFTFKSSSSAASVVAGSSRSGPQSWLRGGRCLRDIEAENAKLNEQAMNDAVASAEV